MNLGLQGVTVVFASGDAGVAGRPTAGHEYGTCLGSDNQIFSPTFPVKYTLFPLVNHSSSIAHLSSCPYVPSVGGTEVAPNSTVFEPETAAVFIDLYIVPNKTLVQSLTGPGGGFPNLYPAPGYQKDALNKYFS